MRPAGAAPSSPGARCGVQCLDASSASKNCDAVDEGRGLLRVSVTCGRHRQHERALRAADGDVELSGVLKDLVAAVAREKRVGAFDDAGDDDVVEFEPLGFVHG